MMKHHFASAIAALMALVLVLTMGFAPVARAEDVTEESTCGSVELKIDVEDVYLDAKLSVDLANSLAAMVWQMEADGTALDFSVFGSQTCIAFGSSLLDQVYGIDRTTAEENLPKSIFAPDSGSAYALDEETYASLMEALDLEHIPEEEAETGEDTEAVTALAEKYGSIIVEAISGKLKNEAGFETITIGTEEIRAMVTSVTLDTDTICGIVEAILSEAAQDEELKALAAAYFDQSGVYEVTGMTGGEMAAEMWENMDEFTQEAVAYIQEAAVSLSGKMYMKGASAVAVALEVNVQDDPLSILLTLGEEPLMSGEVSLVVTAGDVEMIRMAYEVVENTEETYAARFSFSEGDTDVLQFALAWDKIASAYVISTAVDGVPMSLSGTVTQEEDAIIITLDAVNGVDMGEISLTLREEETVEIPAFTEILTLTEEQAGTFVEGIMAIYDILYGAEEAIAA